MNTLYTVARAVLLDALDALNEQRDAVVLVGAQAIYLHTGDADIAVPPFTSDGDLAIEPSRLKNEPKLAAAICRSVTWIVTAARDAKLSPGARVPTLSRSTEV